MKKTTLSFLMLTLAACSTPPKKYDPNVGADSPAQARFDQGVRALDDEDYAKAAKIFDGLLLAKPGTDMDLVALFNSGAAYEGLGDCQKASDRYRQVVRSSATKFKRIEGEAL